MTKFPNFWACLETYEDNPIDHQMMAFVRGLQSEGHTNFAIAKSLRAALYEFLWECIRFEHPQNALDFLGDTATGYQQFFEKLSRGAERGSNGID